MNVKKEHKISSFWELGEFLIDNRIDVSSDVADVLIKHGARDSKHPKRVQ